MSKQQHPDWGEWRMVRMREQIVDMMIAAGSFSRWPSHISIKATVMHHGPPKRMFRGMTVSELLCIPGVGGRTIKALEAWLGFELRGSSPDNSGFAHSNETLRATAELLRKYGFAVAEPVWLERAPKDNGDYEDYQ